MTNTEILAIAAALASDSRIMGWSTEDGGTAIQLWWLASSQEIQLRHLTGPGAAEHRLFPGTHEGLTAARTEARMRAEVTLITQGG